MVDILEVKVLSVNKDSKGNVISVKLKDSAGNVMDNISVNAVKDRVNKGILKVVDVFTPKNKSTKFKENNSNAVRKNSQAGRSKNMASGKKHLNEEYKDTLKQGSEYPLYIVVKYSIANGKDYDIVKYGPFYENDKAVLSLIKSMLDKCISGSKSNKTNYFDYIDYAKKISTSAYFQLTNKYEEYLDEYREALDRINFEFMFDPLMNNKLANVINYGIYRNMTDVRNKKYVTVIYSIDNDKYRKRKTFGPFYTDSHSEKIMFSNFKSTLGVCMSVDTDDYTDDIPDLKIWAKMKGIVSPAAEIVDRIGFQIEPDRVSGGDAKVLVFDVYASDESNLAVVEKFIQWEK